MTLQCAYDKQFQINGNIFLSNLSGVCTYISLTFEKILKHKPRISSNSLSHSIIKLYSVNETINFQY